ncbi:nucleoside-diphosphate sugar epimerase/dehydratase [Cognatishimia sp. F0-27]|uniref:polysaccharide biosynthesis protein n=1 Tax=Cognatishimia sp. F0-27 TaxID=2816855 RepID=UPI001D0CD715|nr:nucleoside-diphosphate sugar epimerase/dehydratase [Cognatishimia sp. F0-27]MCC1494259.1 polysaccharide biosynthesis protein [Cognatishimia sp. F0-27]
MLYSIIRTLSPGCKQAIFMLADVVMIAVALYLALVLSASTSADPATLLSAAPLFAGLMVGGAGLGWWLGLPHMKLNAYEMRGILRTATFATGLGLTGVILGSAFGSSLSFAVFFNFTLLLMVFGAAWRIGLRHLTMMIYRRGQNRMRVMIYGAGQTGQQLASALRHDHAVDVVAFIDDDPTLQSTSIQGIRVYGASRIKQMVAEMDIQRIVLAMPSISQPTVAGIAQRLRRMGCEVHTVPSFAALIGREAMNRSVSPVSLDDLLGRNQLEKELPAVSHAYTNRRILITGAGGSIGSELCRQLVACKPECVVLVDHSELGLYNIEKELKSLAEGMTIVPVLASVLDQPLMTQLLEQHRIEVVLHAAAYKHLPMVECNPISGLRNNVIGTKVMADAARVTGVERFILVSSDKAVRPTNVMGASKRLAELLVQDLATRSAGTRFSMVRFGNVLGSSGSVIPLFKEQIERGGPVTLTHGDVTRYFMTISEAARLVLLAGSFAQGGEVFVLDMGDPVPIKELARKMIEGAGFQVKDAETPEGDIEIKIVGLRPGEKLHEELLIEPDMLTTPHPKILRAQESYLSEFEMATAIKDLRLALETRDADAARAVIARWVEHEVIEEQLGTV